MINIHPCKYWREVDSLIPAGTSHGQSLPVRVRRRRNAVAVEVHTRAANRARNQAAIRLFHALTMTFVYLSSILFCGCSLVYALLLFEYCQWSMVFIYNTLDICITHAAVLLSYIHWHTIFFDFQAAIICLATIYIYIYIPLSRL